MKLLKRWIASWQIEVLVALPYTPKRSPRVDSLLQAVEDLDA